MVTRSKANVVYELDGQSILQLYKKYLGDQADGLPATGLLFPLSVALGDGEERLVHRRFCSTDEAERGMTFAGDVPEGSLARLMKANFERLVDGAADSARQSRIGGSAAPDLAMLISCVGRKLVLKQRVDEEVESVQETLGTNTVMTGFYSYGEICPVAPSRKQAELHNQTMTITTFSERTKLTVNKLLQRQIERFFGSMDSAPKEQTPLFDVISDTYDGFDADRRLIERSLDISSEELTGIDQRLRTEVSERRQAQEKQDCLVRELEETTSRLEKVNKELNAFAYVVSHDLKAPLRGIRTLADWIATDYADRLGTEGQEQIRLLLQRTDRMHELIDGILQYSRAGRMTEDRVRLDLQKLVPEVIDLLAPCGNIEITIGDELPTVELERTRVLQVFQNLLSNAIKYMDKPEGHIAIGCRGNDAWWTFSIADNGPGIDEKYHEKIFQLFQTVAPQNNSESTGIGLSLVKKIVELYGGEVWVESALGAGSTFFFTLPRCRRNRRRKNSRPAPPAEQQA